MCTGVTRDKETHGNDNGKLIEKKDHEYTPISAKGHILIDYALVGALFTLPFINIGIIDSLTQLHELSKKKHKNSLVRYLYPIHLILFRQGVSRKIIIFEETPML